MNHTDRYNIELAASLAAQHVTLYKAHTHGAFDFPTMVLKMVTHIFDFGQEDYWNIPDFIEWAMSNKDNTLPFTSSGSFMTALCDQDNFISQLTVRMVIDDEDYDEVVKIFNDKIKRA